MTQFFIALLKFLFIFRMQNFFWFVGAYSFAETHCSRNHKWLHINTQEGSETGKAAEAIGKSEAEAQHCNAMQCIAANIRLSGRAACCSTYFKPLPRLLLGEGMEEPGTAFAAQHRSDSMIQRKEFAMLSCDGAMLLLSQAQGNHLLPLTKCKSSREGSSSKFQIPKPSGSKDREVIGWSLTPLRIFFLSHGQPQTQGYIGSLWGRQTWFSLCFCNFLTITTPSFSIYSIWCSHQFSLASGGYIVPHCRSSCLW